MNIKIEDYVSKEEIKETILNILEREVERTLRNEREITRIITNISYRELWKKIDETIPNCSELLKNKTIEHIKEMSSVEVFREKEGLGHGKDSIALQLIDSYVEENRKIIDDKIKEIFNAISKTDLVYEIQEIINTHMDNLFLGVPKKESEE